ncbi:MAG: hypothetical protein ACLP1E_03415 [Acidimicrobiales bacterium]
MRKRPQATTGRARRADFPDPLAPLRGLPELSFESLPEVLASPAVVTQDALGQDAAMPGGPAGDAHPRVNTHVHLPPNFSAFEAVEQAVELAAGAGLRVLGGSNYYDFGIYARFAQAARAAGVFPLFGVEIISLVAELKTAGVKLNDPDNPGRMYLCGKGITRFSPMSSEPQLLMQRIRDADRARMNVMIERMTALMQNNGIETAVRAASVQSVLARRYAVPANTVYLQERHVAQAFQEELFARVGSGDRAGVLRRALGVECTAPDDPVTVQNQIRSHLMKAGKPAYVEESVLDADMAYALVLALGGVPCYPILADGASPVCQFEDPVDDLVEALVARGIWCAEIIPSRNAATTVDRYATALRGAGIIVLGGTEHNTLELAPITPECKGHLPVSERVAELFWEGACVVAAHQYLSARGQTGYVDALGRLNPGFTTRDRRIGALARLGSMVIEAFHRPDWDRSAAVAPTNTTRAAGTTQP